MNQSFKNKTVLASAILMSLTGADALAAPDQLRITSMTFGGFFASDGYLNSSGTVGAFDPLTDLDEVTPGVPRDGRVLAPGFNPLDASGNLFSLDAFNGHAWEAQQQTVYLDNTGTWSGTSAQGPHDFNNLDHDGDPATPPVDVIAGMSDTQIAVGMFFDWNGNNEIAVLEIFDCDASGVCTGNGVPMANGPFAGAIAIFNAGLSCIGGSTVTGLNTLISIDIATDVLAIDNTADTSNCNNPTATTPTNPEGLRVDSVVTPSPGGATVTLNGTAIDYTPEADFEGPDTFNYVVTDDTGKTTAVTFSVQVGGELQSNFTMLANDGSTMGGSNDVDIVWDETTYNSNVVDPATVDATGPMVGFGVPTDATGVMTISSPQPFFGFNWYANNVRVFKGPAKLKFDIACELDDYNNGITDCRSKPLPPKNIGERYLTLELADGEVGTHMVFDWGSITTATACGFANCDIDVVNKWDENAEWSDPDGAGGINNLWLGAAGIPPASEDTPGGPAIWRLVSKDIDDAQDLAYELKDKDGNSIHVNGKGMIDGAFLGSNANFNYKPDRPGTGAEDYNETISPVKASSFSFGLWTLLASLFSIVGLRKLKK